MNIISSRNLELYYGAFHALKGIDMDIEEKQITALIGPSGCGKSTVALLLARHAGRPFVRVSAPEVGITAVAARAAAFRTYTAAAAAPMAARIAIAQTIAGAAARGSLPVSTFQRYVA